MTLGAVVARATTVTVPDDFATIQSGVDHLPYTDTLLVRPGTYPERVYLENSITIIALGAPGNPGDRPRIGGLYVEPADAEYGFRCVGLHLTGPANTHTGNHNSEMWFESCQFDSGLVDLWWPSYSMINGVSLTHCTVYGQTLINAWVGRVDSCEIHGPVWVESDITGQVRWNHIEVASGRAVTVRATGSAAIVSHNFIHGGDGGVFARCQDADVAVEDNEIEDCAGIGIETQGEESVSIARNHLTRCSGNGIQTTFGRVHIADNIVLNSAAWGIACVTSSGVIERNVVSASGGAGFDIRPENGTDGQLTLANNTSSQNAADGYVLDQHPGWDGAYDAVLNRNIGFGNRGFGLLTSGPVTTMSCNDWFANDSGAVSGIDPSPDGFAVDPRFCDVANGDVHLAAGSPLLDAIGCGLIGALGQGCDTVTTAALVTLFTAERESRGVRLRWHLADAARFAEVWIERADVAAGPWSRVESELSTEGEESVVVDRTASVDREYWYRLAARTGDAVVAISDPVRVRADLSGRFELTGVAPNPGFGTLRINFVLARQATVELDVFDLQGRHVASLAHGTLAAGAHTVEWSGRSAPGVYLLDYRYPGGHQIRRLIRLR